LNTLSQTAEYGTYYKTTFHSIVASIMALKDDAKAADCVTRIIANMSAAKLAHESPTLQEYLRTKCLQCAQGLRECWDLFETAMDLDSMTQETKQGVACGAVQLLGDHRFGQGDVLKALGIIAEQQPELLSADEKLHVDLVPKLLGVMEASDTAISAKAGTLRSLVDTKSHGPPPIVRVIQENLDDAGLGSLE